MCLICKFVLVVDSLSKTHKKNLGAVRTPEINPCVRQDLSTNQMDSKVVISMRELSQLLAIARISISTSQEEKLLIAVESLSTSLEMVNETKTQELQKDFLCENGKEVDILEITYKGEHPEIEEFSIYMTADSSCAQTTAQLEEEDPYYIVKEREYQDYIKRWFQEVTQPQYHSFIRRLLMQRQVSWLNFHI